MPPFPAPDGFPRREPACSRLVAPLVMLLVAAVVLAPSEARGVPSFARQSGLPCTGCHTAFPELNPFGRWFKLNGYVFGSQPWVPPVAAMVQSSFTRTEAPQPGGAAPGFGDNDNLALQQASVFYGGRILWKLGALAQGTYDGVADRASIDNTDLRLAGATRVAEKDLTVGLTLNNNPTVQDVWNTTPAWAFPYASSSLAPTPAAATLIEGSFAQQVGGLGAYAFWNDMLYAEVTVYRSLSRDLQRGLGLDVTGGSAIDGGAPYWRLALQHTWSEHALAVGTYGMVAETFPGRERSAGSDRFTDVAVDAQYQYLGAAHGVSVQATWIHEQQQWRASQRLGLAANRSDSLQSLRAKVSYLYDGTYGLTLGYFATTGDADPGLYAPDPVDGSRTARPDSDGFIVEVQYLPFNKHPLAGWPWLNARLSLQYVLYERFNGARRDYDGFGRDASDNNTLYVLAWIAF